MAAVPITISGVLCDKYGRTIQPVMIVGEASITGLGVGGGPVIPPSGGGGAPPGTGIWPNPPEGQAPIPSHPIVLPGDPSWGPPTEPPPSGESKPPPEQGGWGFWAGDGVDSWVYKPAPNEAQPKG